MPRGGKRKGAGAPKKPNKKLPLSVKINPELLEWLRKQPNMILTIETALTEYRDK